MKRLAVLALACIALAGCGPYSCMVTLSCGANIAHSDYYLVTFVPETPAPSDAGVDALTNAVREAQSHRPDAVDIRGTAPPDGPVPPLAQTRAQAIAAAFAKAGIDLRLVRTEIAPDLQTKYAEAKDSFIIRLDYGTSSQP